MMCSSWMARLMLSNVDTHMLCNHVGDVTRTLGCVNQTAWATPVVVLHEWTVQTQAATTREQQMIHRMLLYGLLKLSSECRSFKLCVMVTPACHGQLVRSGA